MTAAHGPGKYDGACSIAREITEASLVLLIVVGGSSGDGFSVQSVAPIDQAKLAAHLEDTARQLRNLPSPEREPK